jgi:hypothetical protein
MATARVWHVGAGSAKGAAPVSCAREHSREFARVKADFALFHRQNSCIRGRGTPGFSADHGADEAFLRRQAVRAGVMIVFAARRWRQWLGSPGSVRGWSRRWGSPIRRDEPAAAPCNNPTFSCANQDFMLLRMNRGSNRVSPDVWRRRNDRKRFFLFFSPVTL